MTTYFQKHLRAKLRGSEKEYNHEATKACKDFKVQTHTELKRLLRTGDGGET